MPHNISLITTIAAGFGLALIPGLIAARLKLLPPEGHRRGIRGCRETRRADPGACRPRRHPGHRHAGHRAPKMVETARMLNPGIDIIVRTCSDDEAELLRGEKTGQVFMGKHEPALGMTRHIPERLAAGDAGKRADNPGTARHSLKVPAQ